MDDLPYHLNNSLLQKTPFQVVEKIKAELNITIVRASTIQGTLIFPELTRQTVFNLEGYLKIKTKTLRTTLI
jgi:hypothetical protein